MHVSTRRRGPRRLGLSRRERGATIVLVTLSMVVLLGMAAVSIDFAVASEQRSTVQNAADSAALAVASDCALKKSTCSTSTAQFYAQQAAGPSAAVQTYKGDVAKAPAYADGAVTVRVSKPVIHTFARVFGEGAGTVASEATATWKSLPLRGSKLIPIGLPYCDWAANQPVSATQPGNLKTFLWNRFDTTEASCSGVPPTTTGTVYARRGDGGSYSSVGQAMYFTASLFPGFNTNCNFSADLWDVYRNTLDDWSLITGDSCMTAKLSGVGPGDVIMMPIYAVEKKTIFWGSVSYSSRVVIVGFAPFKVDKWINYPFFYFLPQPSFGSLRDSNSCNFKTNFISIGGGCAGVRGRFVRSTEGALFNNFTEYGASYDNPDSGLGGDAPDLGFSAVKLVK